MSEIDYKSFYDRPVWKQLRYRVLRQYGYTCMVCKRTRDADTVIIHVDHIKPIKIYPELALCFENLQVLCEDCNQGKSWNYMDDHRPKLSSVSPSKEICEQVERIKIALTKAEINGDRDSETKLLQEYIAIQRSKTNLLKGMPR